MTAGAETLGPRLGAGREAEVYEWGAGAVVKLYRPGFGGHRAEAAALTALADHGVAPALIDVVELDGRTGLVLERLSGVDMLTMLRRQPWRVLRLGRTLATAQLAVHRVPAPAELPDLRRILAARIEDAALPPRLRSFASSVLDELPDGNRLCHGDYHPGNVLVAADRIAVIDWTNAARGVAEADHARTLLLLWWADPDSDTPLVSRGVIAAGRSALARRYARVYRRGGPQPVRPVKSWLTVQIAARLSEGIDNERPKLLGLLDRALYSG
ncbi:MAG TPA: phosphotransferase [Micromonosporaceae bacterium]|nr:phosphotransferase [Micromonosporaceae bacterium]